VLCFAVAVEVGRSRRCDQRGTDCFSGVGLVARPAV